jgi:hypothetical protein
MVVAISLLASAQQITINKNLSPKNNVQVLSNAINEVEYQVNINSLKINELDIDGELYHTIEANNLSPLMDKNQPDVSKMAFSLQIPNQLWLNQTEILESEYIDYENINLAPSRGVIYRNQNPDDVPYEKGSAYEQNQFYPEQLVNVGQPFIIREKRGESVSIFPFQYNPITKVLRVYTKLRIKNFSNKEVGINPITEERSNISTSSEFEEIYERLFINYNKSRYTSLADQGNILIISHADFADEMNDYVNWKKQRGIPTELVTLAETGTTANEIDTYIETYYNNNDLTFVLLVGDNTHIPSLYSNGDSDQAYAQISGNDHYPEIIIGRFSVETVGDVATLVEKSIWYERDVTTADSWLEKATGIASNEGGSSSDDGESDQDHMENIRTDLLSYGYIHVDQAYQNNGVTDANITSYLHEGRGLINYVGHGDNTLWVTSGFDNNDIDALNNENKLPFIFDVACVNGNFHNQTCFAEAWTRANNGGKLTGAVAIIASTVNQPWNPPMDGQDEMVDILIESYTNNIKRTFGGITYNGVMHMLDEYPSDNGLTADTWTIFGDPALHVRTKTPMVLSATHSSTLTLGETSFTVNSSVEGATVALSTFDTDDNIVLLGTGTISGGSTNINIPAFTQPTNMIVTVTGYNYIPYIENVQVIATDGPYLVYQSYSINDAAENNNNMADYGENILLDLAIKNVGTGVSNNANVTISTTNSHTTINDNTEAYETVTVDETKNINNAFGVSFADDIQDQTNVLFDANITDDNDTYQSTFSIVVNAPSLEIEYLSLNDATGNDNGVMDEGESVIISVKAKNIGHAATLPGTITANENSTYFTLTNTEINIDALSHNNGEYTAQFTGTVSSSVPDGESVDFTFTYNAGNYNSNLSTTLPIGISLEDWESETFDTYDWDNTGTYPWIIVSDVVFDGDYASKSGDIENSQESVLSINLEVTQADSVSFYKKVSCEDSEYSETYDYWYDYFKFDIDGTKLGQWDGEHSWSRNAYYVASGEHTLTWTYYKDNYADGGSDAAWLDNITLPPHQITSTTIFTPVIEDIEFTVYPVPAKDFLNIEYTLNETENVSINITDISGKLVKNIINNNQNKGHYNSNVNIESLNKGIYFVSFVTKNNTSVKKLIIE